MIEKQSAYIVTKPLQYINATNIPDNLRKDCFVVNYSSEISEFYEVVKNSGYWNNVKITKNRYLALLNIILNKKKYLHLFIDSDYGIIITFFFFLLRSVNIFTYEEGYGSYRYINNGKTLKDRIKKRIYTLMGCQNWIGGNVFTDGQYLYHPEVFKFLFKEEKIKKVLKFKEDFNPHLKKINKNQKLFKTPDINHLKNRKVLLYLTGWHINPDIYKHLKKYPEYFKILKPHPHIKKNLSLKDNFDLIIQNSIPAEILLNQLVSICNNPIIIHENSSSIMYLPQNRYVEINISIETSDEYNMIVHNINRDF